jgi:phosphopantothenoylcysteine decarboxylase/phosphopantothenate--cysteine ligase
MGYQTVIANRGEEQGENGEQIAYLVTSGQDPERLVGKKAIALGIVNHLEAITF